jgi:polar amino acid transport system substrate-binding protein
MTALNEDACKDNPIDIKAFPDNPTAVQELILGRVDAHLSDDPVAAYSALQSEGDLVELAVTGFEAAEYGIGVRKESPDLQAVLERALAAIIADGTYAEILDKWGQTEFGIE